MGHVLIGTDPSTDWSISQIARLLSTAPGAGRLRGFNPIPAEPARTLPSVQAREPGSPRTAEEPDREVQADRTTRVQVDRTEHGKDPKLNQLLDSTDKGIKAGLGRIREVVSRYRRLATLGQRNVLLHDGRTPITVIADSVEIARRKLAEARQRRTAPEIEASLEMIAHQAEILNQLMERLAPFSGRPRGRYELADLESVIKKAFAVYQAKIDKEKVKPILPEGHTPIRMDPIDLELLFLNLIDNSLYWLLQVPEGERKSSSR